ncbi:MAG: sensor domain-containing diguanylate cyclase [Pseudomonadota bacterium]|nr:sensor domain-containing diguanylate cyclase [Pseudomonadota bacterium]
MEPRQSDRSRLQDLNDRKSPLRRSLWAAGVYLIVGLIWIMFSDRLVEIWFPNPRTLSLVQTWKGFFFVGVTGAVLFWVLFRQLTKDRMLLSLQLGQRQALKQRERQLTVLMDNLPGMAYRCLFDEHWTMLFLSGGSERLTGYRPDELIHNKVVAYADLMDQATTEQVVEEVGQAVRRDEPFSLEYAITRKDGTRVWVWERGCAVQEDDGTLMLEGIVLDISDRKALETELEEMATRDPLTGLFNRREFTRVLNEELERANRYERPMALLWIDFDRFKDINDTWGHAAGDAVLCDVSHTLLDSVRSVDTVGRIGGEEFVVVLPELDVEEAREAAERLRIRVREQPVSLDSGHDVNLTISIGVAVYPDHGHSADALCAAADKAMYRAKNQGRDCVTMAKPVAPIHNES